MALSHLVTGRRLNARAALGFGLILGSLGVAACDTPVGPIDDATYVEVTARLAHATGRFIDPQRADSARRAVLADAGVSPEDLVGFAETFGGDPQRMFALHELIRARVDSLDAEAATAVPRVDEDVQESEENR